MQVTQRLLLTKINQGWHPKQPGQILAARVANQFQPPSSADVPGLPFSELVEEIQKLARSALDPWKAAPPICSQTAAGHHS